MFSNLYLYYYQNKLAYNKLFEYSCLSIIWRKFDALPGGLTAETNQAEEKTEDNPRLFQHVNLYNTVCIYFYNVFLFKS